MKKKLLFGLLALFLSATAAMAQVTVTGVVKDKDGPVVGASVVLKGTTNGVSTNLNGEFRISVPNANSAVLDVNFVGMKPMEFPLKGKTSDIEITLLDDATALEDVVVIGYGNTIRANLTGSVGSVSGAALAKVPVASAAEALVGKIAGVQVSMVDGAPGSEVNIRIRGGTSVTQSNEPLYIVDGFPQDNINDIPPTDIQSIDILKDASLTAIYGARGGNGVVIVTTKAAKSGKIKIDFNHTTSIRTLARKLDVLDPYEFVKVQYDFVVGNNARRQKFRGNFGNPADFDLYKRFGNGNDWQDEILGNNPVSQMYNLTVGGGSENLRFNTSVTHNDEKGVLVGSGVMRTNANTKIMANLSPKVKIYFNSRLSYRQDKGAGADAVGSGGIMDVLRYRPTNGLRDFSFWDPEVIDYEEEKYFEYSNPKGDIDQNYRRKNTYEFTNQASVEWNILPGLYFKSEGSLALRFYDDNRFYGYLTSTAQGNNNLPVAEITNRKRNKYQWTNTLTYSLTKNLHNFTFLVGQEISHSEEQEKYNASRYFPKEITPSVALNNMAFGTPWKTTSRIDTPDRTASFFGQVAYNFDGKYLAQATFRADGSTRFAQRGPAGNQQWGYFPAISAGWVISNENFMQNQRLFSLLKLRAAIGMAGNNDVTNDMSSYQYGIYSSGDTSISWGEKTEMGNDYFSNSGGSTLANPRIKWETTITRNLAFDIEMFDGRLSITPEVYWNTTKDLLYKSPLIPISGYVNQMQNIGQVTSRGFELTVNGTIVQKKDFYLSGNLTFGSNKRRIDKLNGTDDVVWFSSDRWKSSDYDYCLKVGSEVGLIYGYVYDGIYGFDGFEPTANFNYSPLEGTVINDALFGTYPGRPKFKNFVDYTDGETDVNIVNDNDKVIIGNTNPKFSGGFGLSGVWKDLDFAVNFTYMYGFDVNNATRYQLSSFQGNTNNYYNLSTEFNENRRWRYANDDGDRMLNTATLVEQYKEMNSKAVIFNPTDIDKRVTHSYFIEDGSFLRLQDVTLGYTLPKRLTNKIGIERLRVYFSGYNLFIWTKYKGYDPEVDIQASMTPGVDYNRYPRSRNFVFGLNLSF